MVEDVVVGGVCGVVVVVVVVTPTITLFFTKG